MRRYLRYSMPTGTGTLSKSCSLVLLYKCFSLITINNKQPQKLTWNTPLLSNMTVDDKKPAAVTGAIGKVTYTITAAGDGSATVNSETGYVTAISAGQVTLIATAAGTADYESATASQEITIKALQVPDDADASDLEFTLSEFNADGSPKLIFVNTTLSPTKYVVIVRGPSKSNKSNDAINFWGSILANKLANLNDAISSKSDFDKATGEVLGRITGQVYKVAVYAVDDQCLILPKNKDSSTKFLQSVPGTTKGVLGVQHLEYTAQ